MKTAFDWPLIYCFIVAFISGFLFGANAFVFTVFACIGAIWAEAVHHRWWLERLDESHEA